MTSERKQEIETHLYDYPEVKRRYRVITRAEYSWNESMGASLPTDSLASAAIDGMPHGSEVSNPTLRLVVQREELLQRLREERDAALRELLKDLLVLTDEIVLMEATFADMDSIERALIDWRYWQSESKSHPPSYRWLADKFKFEETRSLRGMLVPTDRKRVSEALNRILGKIERAWYGEKNGRRRNLPEIPQKFTRNSIDTSSSV